MNSIITLKRGDRVEVRLTDAGSTQSFYAEVQQEDGKFVIMPCGASIDKDEETSMFSGENWEKGKEQREKKVIQYDTIEWRDSEAVLLHEGREVDRIYGDSLVEQFMEDNRDFIYEEVDQ